MAQTDEKTWADLMSRSQKGDKAAYNKLLSSIYPYIKNFLRSGIADQSALDDIVQEVIISVHHSMNTYDATRSFKPWLHAIINYRRLDYLRKHYRKKT